MSAAELLKRLPQALNADAAAGIDCTIQFACQPPVYARIRDGRCQVGDGITRAPDLTITMDDDDLVSLLKGELNAMSAYLQGRLQVDGDLLLAQRMPALFDSGKF